MQSPTRVCTILIAAPDFQQILPTPAMARLEQIIAEFPSCEWMPDHLIAEALLVARDGMINASDRIHGHSDHECSCSLPGEVLPVKITVDFSSYKGMMVGHPITSQGRQALAQLWDMSLAHPELDPWSKHQALPGLLSDAIATLHAHIKRQENLRVILRAQMDRREQQRMALCSTH